MKRISFSLALLVGMLAFTSTWFSWKKNREHTIACLRTTEEISRLTAQLAQLRTTTHEPNSQSDKAAPSNPPPKTPSFYEQFEAQAKRTHQAGQDQLYRDPKLQFLYQEKERARIRASYALLFRKLSLAPEEQAALVQAQLENVMTLQDLKAVAREKGLAYDDPALKAQRDEAATKLKNQVTAIMGPDGFMVLRNYNDTEGARKYVCSFAGMLSGIGQPLASDQAEGLVNAIAEIIPNNARELKKSSPEQWDQISLRAQKILSPEQWNYFQNTTPPNQSVGRWPNALEEMLTKIAGPGL